MDANTTIFPHNNGDYSVGDNLIDFYYGLRVNHKITVNMEPIVTHQSFDLTHTTPPVSIHLDNQ